MKRFPLLIAIVASILISCSKEDSVTPDPLVSKASNPIYLDANGITIKAHDWSNVGDTGTINGETYTVVDNKLLRDMHFGAGDITKAVTTKVTNLSGMFDFNGFNEDIGSWDVSNVTNMDAAFRESSFNQNISNWNISRVTNISRMFASTPFNHPIGNWDVSAVTSMRATFNNSSFNQDIGDWDVSNVTAMSYMFFENVSFNNDLSRWDVSKVDACSDFSFNAASWTLPKPTFTNCDPN